MTLSLWTVLPGNCCVISCLSVELLSFSKSQHFFTVCCQIAAWQGSPASIIDTTRLNAASGVSLCHENTSASVIAYVRSLHTNQIILRKMDNTNKSWWKNCIFCVVIQRIWYGMYAHNLSNSTNKTNFLFLLESNLKSIWLYTIFLCKKMAVKESIQPLKSIWG